MVAKGLIWVKSGLAGHGHECVEVNGGWLSL